MSSRQQVSMRYPRKLECLGDVEALIERVCANASVEPQRSYFVTLAVSEWVSNVVRHGNCKATEDVIDMSIDHVEDSLVIVVEDNCSPLEESLVETIAHGKKQSIFEAEAVGECSESGRGLGLIAHACNHVEYTRQNSRNRLEMRFKT